MIHIEDKVRVNAPRADVAKWFRSMPQHYSDWHPTEHRLFQVVSGPNELQEGSVIRAVEMIGRKRLAFKFRINKVVSNELVEWRATFPHRLANLEGSFEFRELDSQTTQLTAVTRYGCRIPVISGFIDRLMDRLFVDRQEVARHMFEEGQQVRTILEKDSRDLTSKHR